MKQQEKEFLQYKTELNRKLALIACSFLVAIMLILLLGHYFGFQFTANDNNINLRIPLVLSASISIFILIKTNSYKLTSLIIVINIVLLLANNILRNQLFSQAIVNISMFIIIISLVYILFSFNIKIQLIIGLLYSSILLLNISIYHKEFSTSIINILLIVSTNIISFYIAKMHHRTQLKIFDNHYEIKQQEEQLKKNTLEINEISNFISICKVCHNIQMNEEINDKISAYYHKHEDSNLSINLCPDCTG